MATLPTMYEISHSSLKECCSRCKRFVISFHKVIIHKEVRPSCTIWSFNTQSQDSLIPLNRSTITASELLNMSDLINRQLVIPGRDVMECTIKVRVLMCNNTTFLYMEISWGFLLLGSSSQGFASWRWQYSQSARDHIS